MVIIRQALQEDSRLLTDFILEAIEELVYAVTGFEEINKAKQQLLLFVQAENTRFSYQNCLVAQENGNVLAAALIYTGQDASKLDVPVNAHLKRMGKTTRLAKECKPNELYIDSIAVAKHARGRGIASMLLEEICREAKKRNLNRVSLLVDQKKPRVKSLYERCGFHGDGTFDMAGHHYFRMIKMI